MSYAADQLDRVRQLVLHESPDPEVASGSIAWLQCLCRAAARALPAAGAGISVMISDGAQGLAAASDRTSQLVEELQFTLGEGPCRDAHASGRPVLAADLGGDAGSRWPAYSPAALENGVEAVFAFPMRIGVARLGVLDVYRVQPGSLSPDAVELALRFADVALLGLLDAHERVGVGRIADEIDQVSGYRVEVYQAQGMIQIQLGVSGAEALVRLRAQAFAQGRRLREVARDVVERRLTLERDERDER